MHVLSVFFALLSLFNLFFSQNQNRAAVQAIANEAEALSGNMQIYRNAVLSYARANSDAKGAVLNIYLNLPTWFKPSPSLRNYVTRGKGYVYCTDIRPELVSALARASNYSFLIGVKRQGILHHPLRGATSIRLPAAIPENSVVYADN